jgi:hypothetical protein
VPPPALPVVFPVTLSSTDPSCATESARLLADRIIEVREQLAILLGLPLDTPIPGPISFGAGLLGTRNQDSRYLDNTHFFLDADQVMTRSPSPGFVVWDNPAPVANDIGLGGPLVNCRDQAAGFPANALVHFYWITNGSTLGSLSSLAPPFPGPGPVLPPGYVLGAYSGAMVLDASSFLVPANIRGRWTLFKAARQVPLPFQLYGPGALQVVSVATCVPANATALRVSVLLRSEWVAGTPTGYVDVLLFDGLTDEVGTVATAAPMVTFQKSASGVFEAGNYGQQLYLTVPPAVVSGGTVTNVVTVKLVAFENPNNG